MRGTRNDSQTANRISKAFADVANWSSHAAGKASTFLFALLVIVIWAVTGPLFNYSDTWQLVINTGTTVVTFLMVFLIQNSQNRDGAAIQVKLDELIRVSEVHNSIVGIEHLTEEEIEDLRKKCEERAKSDTSDCRVIKLERKAQRAANKAST
jgi:low affinity Fe/Cu permease